jgi:hypothetical protein
VEDDTDAAQIALERAAGDNYNDHRGGGHGNGNGNGGGDDERGGRARVEAAKVFALRGFPTLAPRFGGAAESGGPLPSRLAECGDLWALRASERRRVFLEWHRAWYHGQIEGLEALCERYARTCDELGRLRGDLEQEVLAGARIVGMTTTAVAKMRRLLQAVKPEIVIVEEAAEVLESHIVTALTASTRHLVLIGDHEQPRPGTAVYRLATRFRLDVSLFERLVRNGVPHVTLARQRRMRPPIARLIAPIYPHLTDHPHVTRFPDVRGVASNLFFLDHAQPESSDHGGGASKANRFEVRDDVAHKDLVSEPLRVTGCTPAQWTRRHCSPC